MYDRMLNKPVKIHDEVQDDAHEEIVGEDCLFTTKINWIWIVIKLILIY